MRLDDHGEAVLPGEVDQIERARQGPVRRDLDPGRPYEALHDALVAERERAPRRLSRQAQPLAQLGCPNEVVLGERDHPLDALLPRQPEGMVLDGGVCLIVIEGVGPARPSGVLPLERPSGEEHAALPDFRAEPARERCYARRHPM